MLWKNRVNSGVWLWIPPACYCAFIFYLSSQSNISGPSWIPDKVAHLALYSGLGWLTARCSAGYGSSRIKVWISAWAFCLIYGISDEFHQYFVPGRTAEVGDVIADMLGGLVGAAAYTDLGNHLRRPKALSHGTAVSSPKEDGEERGN